MAVAFAIVAGIILAGVAVVASGRGERRRRRQREVPRSYRPQSRDPSASFPTAWPGNRWRPTGPRPDRRDAPWTRVWYAGGIVEERLRVALDAGAPLMAGRNGTVSGVWEASDSPAALAMGRILWDESRRTDNRSLRIRLTEGAAAFDLTHAMIRSAHGVSPSAEIFERIRAEDAAYNEKVGNLVDGVIDDRGNVNYAQLVNPVTYTRIFAYAYEGLATGIARAFGPSSGYGEAIHLRLPWTPLQAEAYAHGAYRAARTDAMRDAGGIVAG